MDSNSASLLIGFTAIAVLGFIWLANAWLTRQQLSRGTTLYYSTAMKAIPFVMGLGGPLVLAIALLMSGKMPLNKLSDLALVPLFAMGLMTPLLLEFVLVGHQFDENELKYASPWSRRRSFRWDGVRSLRWRQDYQWIDVIDASSAVFHFSTLLQGRRSFATTALRRIPVAVLAAHPTERQLLENMAAATSGLLGG